MLYSLDNSIIANDINTIINNNNSDLKLLKNKTILITGATGMIASYIVYTCIRLNQIIKDFNLKIVLLVRDSRKVEKLFGQYLKNKNIYIFYCNINEKISLDIKIDYIIHAASIAVTQYFSTKPIEVMLPNFLGTYNLLELACKNDIDGFLFFSAGSVYGKMTDNYSEDMFGSINPLEINSCYSESKKFGEALCAAYWREKNVPIKIVRLAHTYGPTMDLENDKRVFADFINNIIKNENIIMKSDGSAVRDFCYLSDAIDAIFKVLLHGNNGEAYNICNNEQKCSIIELAQKLINLFPEKNLKVIKVNRDESDKYIEVSNLQGLKNFTMLSDKLRKLNWNPIHSIEDGFKRTIISILE